MRTYMISGYIDGEPTQVDIDAKNQIEAKKIAIEEYNFDSIINISRI